MVRQGQDIEIRAITAVEAMPARHVVLRPGRPIESACFPGDDEPGAHHLGAYCGGELLAVASLYPVEMPDRPGVAAFQIRGMATLAKARGMGLGKTLVTAAREFAQKRRAGILWCNARVSASEFYRKLGFEPVGGEFEIPQIGPHYRMMLALHMPCSRGPTG